jgi:hypothetical protein
MLALPDGLSGYHLPNIGITPVDTLRSRENHRLKCSMATPRATLVSLLMIPVLFLIFRHGCKIAR